MEYNIYCDESCHLENDGINVMVIGAIICPRDNVKDISKRIMDIKLRNNTPSNGEVKWTSVGKAKENLYMDLINYFFDDDDLQFRAIVVPDKSKLEHKLFNQTHDDFYYKMYFDMLKTIFEPTNNYNIYIDIKDKYSSIKANKLHRVCSNSMYDFSKKIINKIQPIRSNESSILQLTDILIGAVGYANRKFDENHVYNNAKLKIVSKMKERSKYTLTKTTLYREKKVNLLMWEGGKRGN